MLRRIKKNINFFLKLQMHFKGKKKQENFYRILKNKIAMVDEMKNIFYSLFLCLFYAFGINSIISDLMS